MSSSPAESVVSFQDAHQIVRSHAAGLRQQATAADLVPLLKAIGRTLSQPILADRDFPPFPRATRDGYAVRHNDVQKTPVDLTVAGQVRAGGALPESFSSLESGTAISIMTGAPVPSGADAVVMVEYTEHVGEKIRILRSVAVGENVVPQATEARAGSVLIDRGTVISPAQVALAAAVGEAEVNVFRRPRIAILPTGDEVVSINETPAPNQIRNSNSFSLAAQVIAAGGEPLQLPIAPDERRRLRELIAQGLECDLLLLSGGVSAGEYDLVEPVLGEFSPKFFFTGVQIQPGRPLVFGRARASSGKQTCFFGLPGNPISTMVTFELFARAVVRALSGAPPDPLYGLRAQLAKPYRTKTGLTRFLPGRLSGSWDVAQVEAVKWQGSGDVAAFAQADCLLVIPPDREEFAAGVWMNVLPLRH
jgi:molybdopterin molybdotransferase